MAGDGVVADFSIFETEAWEQRQECAVTNIPYSPKCPRGCVVAKGQWKGAHAAHPHRRCVGPTTWRLLSQLPNYGWKANTWNYVKPTLTANLSSQHGCSTWAMLLMAQDAPRLSEHALIAPSEAQQLLAIRTLRCNTNIRIYIYITIFWPVYNPYLKGIVPHATEE